MTDIANAHDALQGLLWGFASHRVITVAGKTGMLRALASGVPKELSAIASECGLSLPAVGKMVRALTALGLVEAQGEAYLMPPAMASMFQADDADLSFFLTHSHEMYDSWGENLERWVRGDEWATQPRDESGVKRFGQAMHAIGTHVARRVAAKLDLGGARRMLDVGGGVGHFAEAFCRRSPHLTAVVLDMPKVAESGRLRLSQTDMAQRIQFMGGDYLNTDAGNAYDLVLLANVLHQEQVETALGMISRAAQATRAGGRVVVVDFSIDPQKRENIVGALFAINMRSFGDTYTEATIRGWMTEAGLAAFERQDIGPHRWVLSASKS